MVKIYGITFVIFLILDSVWLALISPGLYQDQIGHLLAAQVNWAAAVLFYLLFIAGLVVFAVKPSLHQDSWKSALKTGAFFGLVCYATYDLTNQATMREWPLMITVIDLLWGMFICAMTTAISFLTIKKLSK